MSSNQLGELGRRQGEAAVEYLVLCYFSGEFSAA